MKMLTPRLLDKITILEQHRSMLEKDGKFEKYEPLFEILYLKMAFSILFFSFSSRKSNKTLADHIIQSIFSHPYFRELSRKRIKLLNKLNAREKAFYCLVKLGIINPLTLKFGSAMIKTNIV